LAEITKAVILARGLGKRMRASDPGIALTDDQARAAASGLKAMIAIERGRPFLDYVLSALADSGIREICLVIGPEHSEIRDYYTRISPHRIQISFAVQQEPRGTADALLASEKFSAGDVFLTLNSDNYYPVAAYEALRKLGAPGITAFDCDTLAREGNISRERITAYALVESDPEGFLTRIVEKPDAQTFSSWPKPVLVSVNLWSFGPGIFDACRHVALSTRGELELPAAVQLAVSSLGERIHVLPFTGGILDLSSRSDIASVAESLSKFEVEL
jgi:dTDP-glucose pyrophosphorylase